MNILRNLAGACAVILAAMATTVNASTITLSGPASVAPGGTFDVTISGNFDDVGGFDGGRIELLWDNIDYSLNSTALDLPTTASFSCPGAASGCINTPTQTSVGWGNFFAFTGIRLIPAGSGNTLMATLSFTDNGSGGPVQFSMIDGGFGWTDATGASVAVPDLTSTLQVNTAVIPVPAAVWLFGSGLLGLVGVARRRKAA
jgi:hypothetical protein